MNIITVDCGASFVKGAVFREKQIIRCISKSTPAVHKGNNIFDARHISELIHLVETMIDELADTEKELMLCISNEMHGFLLTKEDGTAYTDYVSWQMELGAERIDDKTSIEKIRGNDLLEDAVLHTGMPLRAGLPSSNLFYIIRKYGVNVNDKLRFYTLGDYLIKCIFDQEPMIHPTNAAATGLFDLRTNDWNWQYIHAIGAENITFPTVGTEEICRKHKGVSFHILPAVGDQQAALLGAGLEEENAISFNMGTGAQVSCIMTHMDFGQEYQIRPYFSGKYLKTIPHIPSGRALNVYVRFIRSVLEVYGQKMSDERIWSGLLNACHQGHECHMKCDLSFFENAVTSKTRGSITDIDENEFVLSNVIRNVLLQMAENFISISDRLYVDPKAISKVFFSGGVAHKIDFLRNRISLHYPNAEIIIAENETMYGLYKYAIQYKEG